MPEPRNLRLLVLEDRDDYVESNYRAPVRDYIRRGTYQIYLEVVQTKDEALTKLREARFDGAILDLRLTGDMNEAEGNIVAQTIHTDYLMPVAIVTAFHDELDASLRLLTEKPSTLFRLFNKGGDGNTVFEFFFHVDKAEVLQAFRPGGEFNAILTSVLWDHLGPVVDRVAERGASSESRRRILRHTIFHVLAFLQRDGEAKDWDPYLNEEVYIVPPVGSNACTGEIIAAPIASGGFGAHFLLITPACDVSKIAATGGYFQLVAISPFQGSGLDKATLKLIARKTHTRYHLLPPAATYPGGIVDFWQLLSIPSNALGGYKRVGQVTDPFSKDIVARLGAWISRQGSPEFQEAVVDQVWEKIQLPVRT